jgi:serine/threonine-protein kinase
VAQTQGWICRLDAWYFGRMSLFEFLSPWSREAKLDWFRKTYHNETKIERLDVRNGQYPSIVAHSFGTYILGNALTRYEYLRFDKVLLCGSILPRDFPWRELIERGQVQSVRNEYGVRDVWAHCVGWMVPQTGPSGTEGFTSAPVSRFEEQRFSYAHSEYFEKGHMESYWVPFLQRTLPLQNPPERIVDLTYTAGTHPIALYLCLAAILLAASALVWAALPH